MKNTLEIVGNVLLIILAIDLFGFMVWIASGQTPIDNFFIGGLTAFMLRLLLGS